MHPHKRKMIAPVVITAVMILYYVVYFCVLMALLPGGWKYLLGIVPLIFSALSVYVCIQRINEIKRGEEDDLGQY